MYHPTTEGPAPPPPPQLTLPHSARPSPEGADLLGRAQRESAVTGWQRRRQGPVGGKGEKERGREAATTHFLFNIMPRGGLSLPAIETGKLQDDDGDITNNDDNSTNNVRSDRHFPVFGQGVRLRLSCICFCLNGKSGSQPALRPCSRGGGWCAARGSKSWAGPAFCQTLPVISQGESGRGVCPESGQVKA